MRLIERGGECMSGYVPERPQITGSDSKERGTHEGKRSGSGIFD